MPVPRDTLDPESEHQLGSLGDTEKNRSVKGAGLEQNS